MGIMEGGIWKRMWMLKVLWQQFLKLAKHHCSENSKNSQEYIGGVQILYCIKPTTFLDAFFEEGRRLIYVTVFLQKKIYVKRNFYSPFGYTLKAYSEPS